MKSALGAQRTCNERQSVLKDQISGSLGFSVINCHQGLLVLGDHIIIASVMVFQDRLYSMTWLWLEIVMSGGTCNIIGCATKRITGVSKL